jgi:multiple sugar transport system permease protein
MTTVPFHRRKETKLVVRYLTAASLVVIFVFPIYWLFAISFKTPGEIFAFPPVWYPKSIQFNNYAVLFRMAMPRPSATAWCLLRYQPSSP